MYKLYFTESGIAKTKLEKELLNLLNNDGYKIERVDLIGKLYVYVLYK